MKAFIGRSFKPEDQDVFDQFRKHFEALKKIGFTFWDAEEVQQQSISEKVKTRIKESDFFIGLLTTTDPFMPKSFWDRWKNKSSEFGTSPWVIQESGFALGLNQKIIFLVEKGIKYPWSDINGDHEKIEFERKNISSIFPKFTQQILDTIEKVKLEKGLPVIAEDINKNNKQDSSNYLAEEQTETENNESKSFSQIFSLNSELKEMISEKKFNKAKEIGEKLKNEWEKVGEPFSESEYEKFYVTRILKESSLLCVEAALKELKDGAEKNNLIFVKNYISVISVLTSPEQAYELCEQFRNKFSNNEKEEWDLFEAGLLFKIKNYNSALKLLLELLNRTANNKTKHDVFVLMSEIEKEKEDIILSLAYLERAVDEFPENQDTRFNLAYEYGENQMSDLAMFHYEKLTIDDSKDMAMNNLGIAFGEFELKFKKSEILKRSWEKGNTLAASNLATLYIDAGFDKEAKELLEEARGKGKYNQRVDGEFNRLSNLVKNEDQKYKKELEKAKENKNFMSRLAIKSKEKKFIARKAMVKIYDSKVELNFSDSEVSGQASKLKIKKEGLLSSGFEYSLDIKITGKRTNDLIDITFNKTEVLFDNQFATPQNVIENYLGYLEQDKIVVIGKSGDQKYKTTSFSLSETV